MAVTPNSDSTTKNTKSKLGLTLAPAANVYPISYVEDTWDVVTSDSADAAMRTLMGGTGQFDQHKINKALAENSGDAELGTAVTASQTVGGISSGTTLSADTTFYDFVDKLLNPFINPSVTLTITPSGIREKGNVVTSITMTAEVTKGTANVAYIEFFREGVANPLHTITSGVTAGGTFTYTYEPADEITTNVSFRASVTDSATTPHTVDSATSQITFADFIYYGTSASTTAPSASGLSSKASSSSETPTFSTNAYVWYITPTAKTSIQQNIMGQWVNIDTTSVGVLATFTNAYGVEYTNEYYAYRSTNMYEAGSNMTFKIV